ncbi:uncharacterized protein N7479_003550 [Penicillium vulpinum]|uniref:Bacteriophage T5 Orf172 DNA-binding domain-containing protein n=1 Tax=Penicillium vulpinum TaxID=29845 RepID=A0A1V6RWK7_9EURO|nr:uncharacterized protein N7479_003550 [Penicillium vulpinum]KAJ5963674.1 hypothetical protein N7479_003550 [Penicillium vulpinum]OQE05968.1 hypothetical protein PENVUL_c020G09478 [Penicillium vulpinum]
MPQIPNTPESLLPRSDSRNPATTCRGITAQGRPCRRSLASPNPSPASTPRKKDPRQEALDVASLYCWQHKDQDSSATPHPIITPAKTRTSIDTLMDRLGVLEINDDPASQRPKPPQKRRTNQSRPSEKPRPKKTTTCCCFIIAEDSGEDDRPNTVQRPKPPRPTNGASPSPNPSQKIKVPTSAGKPQYAGVSPTQASRPSLSAPGKPSSSQTQALLSWIPSTLSPQTTSALLTELAKPISSADDEGYIYMFWVTPPSTTTQRSASAEPAITRDIASSLLPQAPQSSNHLRPPTQPRSISDAIRAAQDLNALTSNPTAKKPGTLRLKIGRTSNVHRRLAEWSKQCSYDLTLIRYYPYTPSSSSSSPARAPPSHRRNRTPSASLVPGRKVPHVHRVERLIHLELAALRVRDLGQCPECGKEHREWFEVEAAKESLRKVDECIRRWVSWGESMT